MMWHSPIYKPVEGDLRVVTKFAWFTKRIGNNVIWLEGYEQLWRYEYVPTLMRSGNVIGPTISCPGWKMIGERVPSVGHTWQLTQEEKESITTKNPRDRGNSNIQPDRCK